MNYSRQLKLDFLDHAGQQKLQASRVIVFGAGGLACTTLAYLASSGVGHITIVDGDVIEEHNLHRQILFTPQHIGQFKAQISAQQITAQNPECRAQTLCEFLDNAALIEQIKQHDLAIDCTDDAAFSLSLNKICCVFNKPVVFANASRMQGQLFVFNGNKENACLCCLWGESTAPNGENCDALGVLGPVPGTLGCLQAIEALKLLLAHPTAPALNNALLQYDFLSYQFQNFKLQKNHNCSHHLSTEENLLMTDPKIFRGSLEQAIKENFNVIDICNLGEREQALNVEHQHIPLEELASNFDQLINDQKNYLLVCKTGKRSSALQQHLSTQGLNNISAFIPE